MANRARGRKGPPASGASDLVGVGYIIPLRGNDSPLASSYVVAVARRLPESLVEEHLPVLATIGIGNQVPYRCDEVRKISLDASGLRHLPMNLYLRRMFLHTDWSTAGVHTICWSFHYADPGCLVGHNDAVAVFRERPYPENELLDKDQGLWREPRLTAFADLDAMQQREARIAVRCVVRDFTDVSDVTAFQQAVLDGRAQEWDADRATFRTPEETRERFQRASVEALDRLGASTFRIPVDRRRWPEVQQELIEHALASGTSPRKELIRARRRNIKLAVDEVVPRAVEEFVSRVIAAGPRPIHRLIPLLDKFRMELVRAIRSTLNNLFTEDFLGPEWRKRHPYPERDSADPAELPEFESVEQLLASKYGRALCRRAKLTRTEQDVLAAALSDDVPLAEWAVAHRMAPNTAYVHKRNALMKLRAAMKLP